MAKNKCVNLHTSESMTVIKFYFAWFNHSMNLSIYRVDSLIRGHNQSQIIQIISSLNGLNNSQVPFVETSCCNKTIKIMHLMPALLQWSLVS